MRTVFHLTRSDQWTLFLFTLIGFFGAVVISIGTIAVPDDTDSFPDLSLASSFAYSGDTVSESLLYPGSPGDSGAANPRYALLIDLNKAEWIDLVLLPGIGEKLAKSIIDYRQTSGPFRSIEELKKIRGIGEKKFAKLAPYLETR